jgi:hypothetical protein
MSGMPRGAKSLAPQLKSWLVRQSLHSQRSVSEHQWLLANYCHYARATHWDRMRDAYQVH